MRRFFTGILTASALLAGLLATTVLLADSLPSAADYSTYVSDYSLSAIVQGSSYIQDWDCGCPSKENRPSWQKKSTWAHEWPTRCLKENHSDVLLKQAKSRGEAILRPVNHDGVEWPLFYYPHGFPGDTATFPRPKSFPVIPFPGWPQNRRRNVSWTDDDRSAYRKAYANVPGAVRPGDTRKLKENGFASNPHGVTPSPTPIKMKYRPGWVHWQVHHIFERRFGGQNNYGNLVPAYSRKGTNQHQKYTSWWTNVVVDSDIKKKPLKTLLDTCKGP